LGSDPNFATTMTTSLALKAPLASATLTGTPSCPNASQGNNSTQIANTSYVDTGLNTKLNALNPYAYGQFIFDHNENSWKKIQLYNEGLVDNHNFTGFSAKADGLYLFTTNSTNSIFFRYGNGVGSTTYATMTPTNFSCPSFSENGVNINTIYSGLASDNSFTGTNSFSDVVFEGETVAANTLRLTRACEKITPITVASNALTVDFSASNAILSIVASSGNMALSVVNLPTNITYGSYTLTFIINTSANKKYISSINVNGNAYTMIAVGGLTNISIDTTAQYVIQQITILFINSSTPTKIITSVSSMY